MNSDGEIADGLRDNARLVKYNSDNDALYKDGTKYPVLEKATKSTRKVTWDGNDYYIDSSTVVFRALNSKVELDPEVISWDNFKDLVLTGDTNIDNQAFVFGDHGKTAKAIVFVNKGFEVQLTMNYYGVVTDKWRSGGDDWVEVDVFDAGKEETAKRWRSGSWSIG